ncbi:50S ribosomal protein L11 [Candidatus Micrarchaeota archaeon]|nr:50S ribosomal protein L11 [Candidatus Micrarchaeota archaeon]
MDNIKVNLMVEGGKANSGPPLGPTLAPLGVNIKEIVDTINDKTKEFKNMTVPVVVTVDPNTKKFEIEVKTPPTSQLIKKAVGVDKGRKEKGAIVGNLTIEQAVEIAKKKMESSLAKDIKMAVKEVVGTCLSMGITVEGKDPREVIKDIDKGIYDDKI